MTDRPDRDPTVDLPPADPTAALDPAGPTRTIAERSSGGPAATTDLPATPTPRPAHTPYDRPTAGRDCPTGTLDPDYRPTAEPPASRPAPGSPGAVPGYEILGELGRGGMGVVWKARHLALDRVVALKMILAGAHAPPSLLARFRDEARAVAKFQHPHIVQIFEVGEFAGLPYFSLEYVDGGTLSKKIAREPQPPRYAAGVVETLARAVQYAHDRNIVHRDIKPGNVLLAADGSPKLTDFGLAKQIEGDSGTTQSGQVVGTPSFMAPEQAEGRPDVGKPADVWALGAVLYDLLTGRPPFAGSSVLDTLEMVRTREPVAPGQLAAHVPRDVETVCLKCLQKDPARRYASAGELADDLRRFLDGRPIVARPVPAYERAWRWARRNRAVAALGSLAAVLLVATAVTGTTFAVVFDRQKDEERKAKEFAEEKRKEAEAARDRERESNTARMAVVTPTVGMFRRVALVLDERLRAKASYAPLRREVFAILMDEFKKVRAATAQYSNPLEDRADGINYQRLGEIMLLANQVADARDLYDKGIAVFAAVLARHPDDPVHRRNLATVLNGRAEVALRLGDAPGGRARYAEALTHRQQWLKMLEDGPAEKYQASDARDPDPARHAVAQSLFLIGKADLELGDPAAAAAHFAAADALFAALPAAYAGPREWSEQTYVWDRRGDALLALGKPAEALPYYETSLGVRDALAGKYPRNVGFQRDAALARMTLGDFHLAAAGDPAAAWKEYVLVRDALEPVLATDPDNLVLRRDVGTVRYKLGVTAGKLPALGPVWGPAAAAAHLAESRRLRADAARVDPRDTQSQVDWMLALGRCGKPEAARAVGWVLVRQAAADRRALFHVACGYATAAGGAADPAEAGRCRDRAFAVLRSLVEQGWKDRFALEADPDLQAIRADPRFAAVVAAVPKLEITGKQP